MKRLLQIIKQIVAFFGKVGSLPPEQPTMEAGIKIEEHLLTLNRWSRPGRKLKGVRGVVIHWVANPGSSAKLNRNWFEMRKGGKHGFGSTQYIDDLDGTIIRMIPEDEIAYGAGAKVYRDGIQKKIGRYPNDWLIHIECTHTDWAGHMTEATLESLVILCRMLLKKYGLNTEALYLHYDITGKECHRWFVRNPAEWDKFKNEVKHV